MADEELNQGQISGSQFAVRAVALIAICIGAFLGFKACHREPPPPVESRVTPASKFTGSDYYSTAFRAREKAQESLKKSDDIRQEQKREEQEFDKKPPKPAEP